MDQKRSFLLTGLLALAVGTALPVSAGPPPMDWKTEDISKPTLPGMTDVTGTGADAKWTITGTGADIGGRTDQFQFAYTTLKGDGGVTARLLMQSGGHNDGWAKTGVMLRESTEPGALMAYIAYTNGNKLTGSFRVETGQEPVGSPGAVGRDLSAGPIWMRVQRKGQLYQLLLSDDGKIWTLVASRTVPIDASKPVLAGLAATMHGGDKPVVATFDNVRVSADLMKPVPAGPTPVQAYPGSGAVLITYGTVANAVGYNIYRQGPDDKQPVKLNTDPVPYAWFIDPPAGGKALTNGVPYRYSVRAALKDAAGMPTESAPSDVVLAEPQVPIAPGFYSYDLGTLTPGATKLDGGVLTVTGSGADIWNATDSFRFVGMPVFGDYSLSAKLLEKPALGPDNKSPWVKVGVMIRETLDPGARNGMVAATTGNGVQFQWRRGYRQSDPDSLAAATGTSSAETQYPLFLRIDRIGDTLSGFQSTDGTSYTPIGTAVLLPNLAKTTYAGLAVTAQNEGKTATAKFDAASVKIE